MDTLKKQRTNARSAAVDYTISAGFMAILLVVALVIMRNRTVWSVLCVAGICGSIVLYLSYKAVVCLSAYFKLNKAVRPITVSVKTTCTKVKLVPITQSRFVSCLFAAVFICENGKRYFFVLPDPPIYNSKVKKHVQQSYEGQSLILRCDKDEDIVYSAKKLC